MTRSRDCSIGLVLLLVSSILFAGTANAAPLTANSDHSGEDHSSENYKNADLGRLIAVGTNLDRVDFKNAIVTNALMMSAILTDANLKNADFSGSNLSDAVLDGAGAKNADFSNAVLDGASFATGDIKNAIFTGASLLGADLSNLGNADRADFRGARYDLMTRLAPGMNTSGMFLVPEPSSATLLILGLMGLEVYARRLENKGSTFA